MHTRKTHRPLRLAVSSLLLAALAILVPTAPAQAHDRLVSSDPESGVTLDEAPEEIGLTFSASVQDIGGSVDLVDGDGEAVEVGSPQTEGATVTTTVEDELPAGDYEVRWRVVSSDGHPISGVVDFTVEEGAGASSESPSDEDSSSNASEFSQAPSESATSSADSPETSDEAAGDDSSEASDEESSTSPAMLLLAAGAIVVVLGAGAALLRSRRRSDD